MTHRRFVCGMLAAGSLLLGACDTGSTPARLELVLPAVDANDRALLPWADQPYFAVTVTAADLAAPSSVTGLPGTVVSLEVAPGLARSVAVKLFPAAGVTIPTHEGSAGPFDLAAGERRAETVDLWLLPQPLPVQLPFSRVSAGEAVSCGITTDGQGWCWGWNAGYGIAPDVGDLTVTLPTAIPVEGKVRRIAVGAADVCAVAAEGEAITCFGQPALDFASGPHTVGGLPLGDPVVEIALGVMRGCAVLTSGKVWCWGTVNESSCWDGNCAMALPSAYEMTGIASAVAIDSAASMACTSGQTFCARGRSGEVWCWGDNTFYQAGEPDNYTYNYVYDPKSVVIPNGAVDIAVGLTHACAIDGEGTLVCWGNNYGSQFGIALEAPVTQPTVVPLPADAVNVEASGDHTCVQVVGGAVYCMGRDMPPYKFGGGSSTVTRPTAIGHLAGLTPIVGDQHLCGLDAAGNLQCIGRATEGQSGPVDFRVRSTPVRVGTDGDWTQVSVAASDSAYPTNACAIRNRRLFCWGANTYGQLGIGVDGYIQDFSAVPVEVGDTDWAQLTRYNNFNCGRRNDGSIWCWGDLLWASPTTTPVQQGSVVGATDVDGGPPSTVCATAAVGLYCWGDLDYSPPSFSGMNGTVSAPTLVTTTTFTQVAVGNQFACGIRPDTTLQCWGNNQYGSLGIGQTGFGPWDPTSVGGTGWVQVEAIDDAACARRDNGDLYCWGDNYDDRLGLPTMAPSEVTVPTQVVGLTQAAIDFSMTTSGVCVTLADHSARCVGRRGDIGGPGGLPYLTVPFGVGARWSADTFEPAVTEVAWAGIQLGSEGGSSCGIAVDGSLWCWGDPAWGGLGQPTVDPNVWRSIPRPWLTPGP